MRTRAAAAMAALAVAVASWATVLPGTAQADSHPAPPTAANPTTVTADPLPTVQVNGVVWAQVVLGNTVYAAGSFTRARPAGSAPGVNEVVRNNLLAYDIRTGQLITSFAPSLNGQALAIAASPDGSRLYVGGDFTAVDGQVRNRVAALTPAGALIGNWRPSVSGQVGAIAASNAFVYLGGSFSAVGGVSRTRLAAVTSVDGGLTGWAPVPGYGSTAGNTNGNRALSNEVLSMVLTTNGTQLVASGRFDSMNGVRATGVAAIDAFSSQNRPFEVNQVLTNQGVNSAIWSVSTDGTNVYGTGYNYYGPGNLEGTFAADVNGGRVRWTNECRGDSYSTYATGGVVYQANHAHDCTHIGDFPQQVPDVWKRATAVTVAPVGTVGNGMWKAWPAPNMLNWFPTMAAGSYTGQFQAGWSVAGNGQYVVYGGEFPSVNGAGQQGLVRFALPSIAPNKVGPEAGDVSVTATVLGAGTVRLAWRAASDMDNENLTYRVYRDDDTVTPIGTTTRASRWWNRPMVGWTDTGVSAGTHTYRVTVTDPAGNTVALPAVSVGVGTGGGSLRPYSAAVRADGAIDYWPLGEASGGTAHDRTGGDDATMYPRVTTGVPGAIAGDGDSAVSLDGSSSSYLASSTKLVAPQAFSLEFWFSTTSRAGGRFIGFGDARTGSSANHDRLVYMDTAGRVNFGVWPLEVRLVTSPASYNDGRWHHVVATLDGSGQRLYVDGRQVAALTGSTRGQINYGYWRIGGDTTWSGAQYVNARMDEVAIYPAALPADAVAGHHALGTTGSRANTAPTAAFTATSRVSAVSVDGSTSTDATGSIRSYSWNWGDGTAPGTGVTASHAYAAAGTYTVTLTVTDDGGLTGTTTRSVTVAANQPPTASFTATASGATVGVNATGSTDADGTVTGYSWAWGDGTAAGSGATASHTYAAAGTYTVTLTVTDDLGATRTATRSVTVTAPTGTPVLAGDAFERTVSGGLGTAEIGGAWTAAVGASRLSVSGGAAVFNLPAAGNETGAYLGSVRAGATDLRTAFTLSAAPTGTSGTIVTLTGRRVSGAEEYSVRVRVAPDGAVWLALSRVTGGVETFPGGEVRVAGLTWTPGTSLEVRVRVTGSGTSTITGTVWATGQAEPAAPQLTRTDTTAALQAPGGVALAAYRPGSNTAATAVRFTELQVTAAQ